MQKINVIVEGHLLNPIPGLPPDGGTPPIVDPPPSLPPAPAPYFSIGDATGKAGETVSLWVEAGCRFLTNGFHIGGGCGKLDVQYSGYGLFEATGTTLGPYLTAYLKAQGAIVPKKDASGNDIPGEWVDAYWSLFQMAKHEPHHALPEEWWEYAVGFFSMGQERTVPPVQIPSGTKLFTLEVKILEGTAPDQYDVTCKDEHYYTQSHQRRRDFLFTTDRDSPLASGGVTKLELTGGTITVIA